MEPKNERRTPTSTRRRRCASTGGREAGSPTAAPAALGAGWSPGVGQGTVPGPPGQCRCGAPGAGQREGHPGEPADRGARVEPWRQELRNAALATVRFRDATGAAAAGRFWSMRGEDRWRAGAGAPGGADPGLLAAAGGAGVPQREAGPLAGGDGGGVPPLGRCAPGRC